MMATEIVDLSKEGVSFLLSYQDESKWDSCEIIPTLHNLVKSLHERMELRTAIFHQQGEKVQQIQQAQLQKLKNEEKQYTNMCENLEKNMADCMSQIRDCEYSIFNVKKKMSIQEEVNEKLKEEAAIVKTKQDNMKNQAQKTHSLYMTVTQWYENYLWIHIDINKENEKIITFYFSNKKNYSSSPYVTFEVLDDFKFKLVELHPDLECNKENTQQILTQRDVISFIYSAKQGLINRRKSLKKAPPLPM